MREVYDIYIKGEYKGCRGGCRPGVRPGWLLTCVWQGFKQLPAKLAPGDHLRFWFAALGTCLGRVRGGGGLGGGAGGDGGQPGGGHLLPERPDERGVARSARWVLSLRCSVKPPNGPWL